MQPIAPTFARTAALVGGLLVASLTAVCAGAADASAAYSPYAGITFPERPLWGDSHLHTSLSLDAALFGNRLPPAEAYRFARGEKVISTTGQAVRLSRPLDWLVIADHSDGMGMIDGLRNGQAELLATQQGARWSAALREGGAASVNAAKEVIDAASQNTMDPIFQQLYSPGAAIYQSLWQSVIAEAERANTPGEFTAFIGFEWTSLVQGNNLHRVVIFRDGAQRAGQVEPLIMMPPAGSPDPLDLWRYLANYEAATGGDILAIPHNGNLSNGTMFPLEAQWNGRPLDEDYVTLRATWEPLAEVTQIKGDGEAHPFLSPDDEFADYETWDVGNLDLSQAKTPDMLAGEYAREALKRGLLLQETLGTNPYRFGMIGATDSHTSIASAEENNFFGKHSGLEPSAQRMANPFKRTKNGAFAGWQMVASGLAAVWARENTRASLFDAMERKEVYASTGPRIAVRFFGGWDFTQDDLTGPSPVAAGYARGVPMGGELGVAPDAGARPRFMVFAQRDPLGANLDRIQIVKGWLDRAGRVQERVYDVAWSGERSPDASGRLPAVGDTVNTADATWTNTIGAADLGVVWADPDFRPEEKAFYYARVLEIPTPRWTAYDAARFRVSPPPDAPLTTQERAYTSPIWYGD